MQNTPFDRSPAPAPRHRRQQPSFLNRSAQAVREAGLGFASDVRAHKVRYSLLAVLLVGIATSLFVLRSEVPNRHDLKRLDMDFASIAYTSDGLELARYYSENRTWVELNEVSDVVLDALLATEDHRFFRHEGVDMKRTISSAWKTLWGDTQGGSTLTQQLARNLFAQRIGRDISVKRKLKEMMLARRLENEYDKEEVLALYLNTVPFGYGAFGIEAAARTYFSKPAADLDVLEAATLVGMLKGTTYYNPRRRPERAQQRRNVVLGQMVRHERLTPAAADTLREKPLTLAFNPPALRNSLAPHFAEHVRNWVGDWAAENGYDLYADGLVIHTTLDSRLQALAAKSVARQTAELQAVVDVEWSQRSRYYLGNKTDAYVKRVSQDNFKPFQYYWERHPERLTTLVQRSEAYREARRQGQTEEDALAMLQADAVFIDSLKATVTQLAAGLVAIEPETRHVRAWVGGRSFDQDKYDHVSIARRQPGSTFKPFVYAAALDAGYSPYDYLPDYPVRIQLPGYTEPWSPGNVGGYSYEFMTLRDGLTHSKNNITAQLIGLVRPRQVARYAQMMGIQSELEAVPALALGTSEVTLLEMVNAYGTFASGGNAGQPVFVTRIEDRNGRVLARFSADTHRAISSFTAYEITDMLRNAVNNGTGRRIRWQFDIDADVAGKTGTTQNSADGWFMLMHPKLVTGAWVGFNDQRLAFRSEFWGQGAHNALFLVGDFMKQTLDAADANFREATFRPPPGYEPPVQQAPISAPPLLVTNPMGFPIEQPQDKLDVFLASSNVEASGISYIRPVRRAQPAPVDPADSTGNDDDQKKPDEKPKKQRARRIGW